METKFQTSFIPKKPLPMMGVQGVSVGVPTAGKPVHSGSLLFNLAILFFIISLGAAGGAYAWKSILKSQQENYKVQLAERQKQFNPALIQQLKQINVKIDSVKQVLERHVALSNIFDIISNLTIQNVRFLNLDVSIPTTQGSPNSLSNIKISLNGYGSNLQAVAFQAKVLSQLQQYQLSNIVKNPVVSDPTSDTTGAISFGFTAEIDPSSLIYMNGASNATSSTSRSQNQ